MIANYYRNWNGFRGRVLVGWAWSVSGLPLSLRTGLQRCGWGGIAGPRARRFWREISEMAAT